MAKDSGSNTTSQNEESILIDDSFWLKYNNNLVKDSIDRVEKSSDKVQTMVGWIWTVYTGIITAGIFLLKESYPKPYIFLLTFPVVLLIVSYFLAGWAQFPKNKHSPNNVISDIVKSHQQRLRSKYNKLYASIWILVLAGIMICAGVIFTSFYKTETISANLTQTASNATTAVQNINIK